jgi:hypothetical protein
LGASQADRRCRQGRSRRHLRRRQRLQAELEAISARAAELVHAEPLQPLPALAPILAPLAALREALERYLARVYPAAVAG